MIVKIENDKKDGYYYYEAEEVEYRRMTLKDAFNLGYDVYDFQVRDEDKSNPEMIATIIIWLFNNERSDMRLIYSAKETYLMNNNGKTIDRLL
jgi:hypothetical protein